MDLRSSLFVGLPSTGNDLVNGRPQFVSIRIVLHFLSFSSSLLFLSGNCSERIDSETYQQILSKYKTRVGVDDLVCFLFLILSFIFSISSTLPSQTGDQWTRYNTATTEYTLYYPTLHGLSERLDVIQSYQVNVFYDNPADGHPYFMDIF